MVLRLLVQDGDGLADCEDPDCLSDPRIGQRCRIIMCQRNHKGRSTTRCSLPTCTYVRLVGHLIVRCMSQQSLLRAVSTSSPDNRCPRAGCAGGWGGARAVPPLGGGVRARARGRGRAGGGGRAGAGGRRRAPRAAGRSYCGVCVPRRNACAGPYRVVGPRDVRRSRRALRRGQRAGFRGGRGQISLPGVLGVMVALGASTVASVDRRVGTLPNCIDSCRQRTLLQM
jgi:hypothetical protein